MSHHNLHLGSVESLASKLTDVSHTLCVATIFDGEGVAHVVADPADGGVIAWDGWYYGEDTDPETPSLLDLDWADWDDMPTKLLIRSQADWVHADTRFWLIPHFTPARAAALIVVSQGGSATEAVNAQRLRNGRLVGYLPVVDRDIYEHEVTRLRVL